MDMDDIKRSVEEMLEMIVARRGSMSAAPPDQLEAFEEFARSIRVLHGRILIGELVGPRLEAARDAGDLEATRSIFAVVHGMDVEGLDWDDLDDALGGKALIADVEAHRLAEELEG